jgi:hypothetical protein
MIRAVLIQMVAATIVLSALMLLAGYSDLVAGFILGTAASMANCALLGRQLRRAAELPMEKAVAQVQTGWFVRLFLAVLLLALSSRFAEVNFLAAVTGFFMFQTVLVIRAVCAFARGWSKDGQERGE